MEKKDFVRMYSEYQRIPMAAERAEMFLEPGRMWDQLDFIKTALFQLDVSGFTPADNLDFFHGGAE